MLVIDVVGLNGGSYLAHRHGGGADGNEPPAMWTEAGMLAAALDGVRAQIHDSTVEAEPDSNDG